MATTTPYTVKKGDTLWALAEKFLNDPKRWPEIWHLNNERYSSPAVRAKMKPSMYIKNPDLIFVGQQLLIPASDTQRQTIMPAPQIKEKHRQKTRYA